MLANRFRDILGHHRGLILILLGYCLLSLMYNAASPIFEPPDEATHFRYVKYLMDHKTLPTLIDGTNRDELWGLHQPPLAFFFYAALAVPFDLIAPDDSWPATPTSTWAMRIDLATKMSTFTPRLKPSLTKDCHYWFALCACSLCCVEQLP